MRLTLTGVGPAGGFPVPGCPCAICSRARRAGVENAPARLESPDGWATEVGTRSPGPGSSGGAGGWSFEELAGGVLLLRAGGGLVLWAPQAGEIGSAVLESLGERLGDAELHTLLLGPAPGPAAFSGEMPSVSCARTLSRLRARGVIGAGTRCLLVGLGHTETHPARLAACLPLWGAEMGSAGMVLDLTQSHPTRSEVQRVLVLGGSGSGKSAFAEQLLSAAPEVVYLATGPKPEAAKDIAPSADSPAEHPEDHEWGARVRKHRERRPHWWGTLETIDVAGPLRHEGRAILLDSVGTWLSGVLDRCGAWEEQPGWRERLEEETDGLLTAWRERAAPLVAVSDEVGWSIVPATGSGRMFREELGRLNAKLADASEDVLVVVAGRLLSTEP